MTVRILRGTVNAYAPLVGQRNDVYTVQAFALPSSTPPAPRIRSVSGGIEIDAPALRSLLVRVPQGVDLTVVSSSGDVNVTDISGNADVSLASGTAQLMLPGYGEASIAKSGALNVTIGSDRWPGTLRFTNDDGDVDLSVNENAKFHVRLFTGNGTIFTDFDLRGSSSGKSETIDGAVNGDATRGVYVETKAGAIRLLRLAPQY